MSFLLVLLLAPFAHADWIADSNQVARDYAVADGARFPERASAAGLREFDGKAIMMEKNSNALELEFLQTWHSRLHDE
ncbi:MAG: hypothetical protein ACXVCG_21695, partial [Bdellovibrionota bacterium]